MALTIQQIQDNITNGGDLRQIINQLADYIQANPGGGGGAATSLTLTSPDTTEWEVTVTDEGVLVTTQI